MYFLTKHTGTQAQQTFSEMQQTCDSKADLLLFALDYQLPSFLLFKTILLKAPHPNDI